MSGFTWWSVVPTLVGGGISALTTAIMFRLNQNSEAQKREVEGNRTAALRAFAGLNKFLHTVNLIENLRRFIDFSYNEASTENLPDQTPHETIGEIDFADFDFESVLPNEIAFLGANAETRELTNLIWEGQLQARQILAVVTRYNQELRDFWKFKESIILNRPPNDEIVDSIKLSSPEKAAFDNRAGTMNRLISKILEYLEGYCPKYRDVMEKFLAAAVAEFGDDLPMKKIVWIKDRP